MSEDEPGDGETTQQPERSESPVECLAMRWLPHDDWENLPEGTWLVKVDDDRNPYHVANVNKTGRGSRSVIVGNHFSFDIGKLIAYTPFSKYDA